MRHRALFAFLAIVSVACGDFCNCNDPTLCVDESSLVWAFDFTPSSEGRTTDEATGTGVRLRMDGVLGDDIGEEYNPQDEIEFIPGGGATVVNDLTGGLNVSEDLTARFIGNGAALEQKMAESIEVSTFTYELWMRRKSGYDDGDDGLGRRLFSFAGPDTPGSETGASDQFALVWVADTEVEARFSVRDNGSPRLARLKVDVLPVGLSMEPEHLVIVVELNNRGWTEDGGDTDLTDEVRGYYNGERIPSAVFTETNSGFVSSNPVFNPNEEARNFAVFSPAWIREGISEVDGVFWQRNFDGDLYWAAVYSEALSESEIEDHYNIGPQFCRGEPMDDSGGFPWWTEVLIGTVIAAAIAVGAFIYFNKAGQGSSNTGDSGGRNATKNSASKALVRKQSKPPGDRKQSASRPVSEVSAVTTASSVMTRVRRNPDGSFVE